MSAPRFAIYFTPPPFSALAQFGARVLGYDCFEGADVAHLPVAGIDPSILKLMTTAPRRYGFHATLVAPFHLNKHTDDELADAVGQHARRANPVPLGRLDVAVIGDFVALVPREPEPGVAQLAGGCVETFDGYRAPMSREDRQRRMASHLSPRQVELMDRWGYPYVLDEFRFHMTLTGPLPEQEREPFRRALAHAFEERAADDFEIDAISLMRQDDPGARFQVLRRCRLRG